MSTRGALEVVRRRWSWLVIATVVGLLAGLCGFLASTPTYRADASVFFSLQYGDSASELVQGSTYTQNQVTSFARLAVTPAVLEPVIDDLDLAMRPTDLAERIEATAPLDTVIVEIAATDPSPERSAEIANAVADTLSRTVERLAPQNADGDPTVRAETIADAEVPASAASPDLLVDLGVGLLAGLLLGAAAVWAREVLDTRVQDQQVVASLTDLPVVGSIDCFPAGVGHPVVVESAPHSTSAEAFRQLRTNLQFLDLPLDGPADGTGSGGVRTLMVTSSVPDEGKSTVAANVAVTLAETGARVLLVDTDLRRPSVAGLLQLEGAAGLTTVLLGRASVDDVVQEWGSAGLQVLTAGAVPPNPSELLGSPAMRRLVQQLRRDYDHVVLDAPPLLPVADAAILSHLVDGTLLVANVTRVRQHQLREGLHNLDQVHAHTLGLVLNQVRREGAAYRYDGDGAAPAATSSTASPTAALPARPAPAVEPAVRAGAPGALSDAGRSR